MIEKFIFNLKSCLNEVNYHGIDPTVRSVDLVGTFNFLYKFDLCLFLVLLFNTLIVYYVEKMYEELYYYIIEYNLLDIDPFFTTVCSYAIKLIEKILIYANEERISLL